MEPESLDKAESNGRYDVLWELQHQHRQAVAHLAYLQSLPAYDDATKAWRTFQVTYFRSKVATYRKAIKSLHGETLGVEA